MMGMVISVVLGILIFGYAAWSIGRFIVKSRRGRCAACSIKNVCSQSDCCAAGDRPVSRKF